MKATAEHVADQGHPPEESEHPKSFATAYTVTVENITKNLEHLIDSKTRIRKIIAVNPLLASYRCSTFSTNCSMLSRYLIWPWCTHIAAYKKKRETKLNATCSLIMWSHSNLKYHTQESEVHSHTSIHHSIEHLFVCTYERTWPRYICAEFWAADISRRQSQAPAPTHTGWQHWWTTPAYPAPAANTAVLHIIMHTINIITS